ncbi:MAG: T9SS type A sorting domain-containing protein [Bacteroidia bacterium]|nr:T9SS type A sorting domain-containing protein [Bacteroidia bacterium]
MQSGSKIEYAHIGVLLGARQNFSCNMPAYPFQNLFAGGVIQAGSATFLDNGIDVKFLPKKGWDDVACYFNSCIFKCVNTLKDGYYNFTNSLPYPNIHNPWAGAANYMQRTYTGIMLERISDMTNFVTGGSFDNMVYGIKSYNTRFKVENGTLFNNVVVGISLDNPTGNFNSHVIRGCIFTKIYNPTFMDAKPVAISINAGTNDQIWNNTFGIPGQLNTQSQHILGISLRNSTGYNIYYNNFYWFTTGISAYNTNTGSGNIGPWYLDPIPQNNFYNCKTGISTDANNSSLKIYCNNFDNYYLNTTNYLKCMSNNGSLAAQGNSAKPAGNTYQTPARRDIFTPSSALYNYYYLNTGQYVPVFQNVVPWQITVPDVPANCVYQPIPPPGLSQKIAQLNVQLSSLSTLRQQLTSLSQNLDKGNTLILLQAVKNNSLPDGQLKTMLVNNSPLSDTVLISVIIKNPALAPGLFKEILSPNLPVSGNVLPYFLAKLASLPPGIANQLKAMYISNTGVVTPAYLQQQISDLEHNRNMLLSTVINQLLDTNQRSVALQLLENENTIDAKQLLAATYIVDTNLAAASAKLNSIYPVNQDIADWLALYNMLYDLAAQHKSLYDMSPAQLQLVRSLAYQQPENLATSNAQGILSLLFNEEFAHPEGNITGRFMSQETNIPVFEKNLEYMEYLGDNYPNPFNETTNIPYYLSEGRKGFINIYDARGMLLQSLEAKEGENILELKTQSFASGVYFYSLTIDGETLEWKKMILIK